jgi:four helix bundle protein
MPTTSFTQRDVWKKAHEVTLKVYDLTELFPRHQLFGLTSQMQRAAYSIPSNMAEGYGRRHPRDKARSYTIAFSSAEELKYFMILSKDRKYRADDPALDQTLEGVSRMLRRLTEVTLRGSDSGP